MTHIFSLIIDSTNVSNYINAFSIKTTFIVKNKTYTVGQCVIGYIYTLYAHFTVMPPW